MSAYSTFLKTAQAITNPIAGLTNLGVASAKASLKGIGDRYKDTRSPGQSFVTPPQAQQPAPVASSSPAATQPTPTAITPPATSSPALQTPAAQQFVQNQAQVASPAGVGSPSPSTGGGTGTGGSTGAGTPSSGAPKDSAYISYLKSLFNPAETQRLARESERANKDFVKASQNYDQAEIAARREKDRILDTPGGLKAGAQEAATMAGRRSNAELADLAVIRSSAANIAGVYADRVKSLTDAGASLQEAEKDAGSAPLSVEDAATLGVPYGTTVSQAQGMGIIPKDAQSISDQFGTGSIGEYNFAKSQGYTGTFNDYQNEDANRKRSIAAAGVAGLTPGQVNTSVNSIASAFDNEPIVKAYNTVQEGYQTINSIGVGTKSPADDIAFIYAFAKIMDPNSVVREGEYNTIQKYAQTWADNFGFSAKRIFSNTNFLTADAKQKMLNTLKPKVDTITNQYTNLNKEYQRQIDDAYAGKPRQITNYAGGVPPANTPIGGGGTGTSFTGSSGNTYTLPY